MDSPANEKYLPVIVTSTGKVPIQGCLMGGFLVATGTPTLTLYDGHDTSGRKILDSMVCTPGTPYPFPASLQIGLYAVISGTASITFFG
jgi:hypothetical protein